MPPPADPLVYHITHVDNLASIVADRGLWSDAAMVARGGPAATIGMSGIKQRRLGLPEGGHAGLMVGACVPFYLCPRSVMLYVLHRGNHPDATYKGGQAPIVHLEARVADIVAWVNGQGLRWAFSLSNASAAYTQFRTDVGHLNELHWNAIQSNDWRDPDVKEGKQAEFLVERFFPLSLVRRVGVLSMGVRHQVQSALATSAHRPRVDVLPAWYYEEASMIHFLQGDILRANAQALVNTVNCVGFMGRGIALQFRRAFPDNFKVYERACKHGEVEPGRMLIHATGQLTGAKYIVNFPTKRHWRGKSRIEDIDAGLVALVADVERLGIRSIAIPPLGCGLGGLDWSEVRPRIERAFAPLSAVEVLIYEPGGAPQPEERAVSRDVPTMTPGRAVLVGLMDRYLRGLMEPWVTLLEVHKLMYFAQVAGEPLRLKFAQAPYGPYAANLRHVLAAIEGHLVSGYADGGDRPDKLLELVPRAAEDARAFLAAHADSLARFERVAELVEGFETPFGVELLASVHWVASDGAEDADAATLRVHAWNPRKRDQFTAEQIGLAYRRLAERGWLHVSA